jgi:hypothetical protein
MPNILRVILSRLLAPWIALLAAWISSQFGVVFTEDQVGAMVDLAIYLTGVFMIHRAIDSRVNKTDVANPILAEVNKNAGV